MTPVERLRAAIEKLERLKAGAFPGPWEILTSGVEGGDHWYVQADYEAILSVSANDGLDEEYREPTAALVVTLHRTIDAQLAILRAALTHIESWAFAPDVEAKLDRFHANDLALADAVVGGEGQ